MLVINNTKHYVSFASRDAPRLRYIALWAVLSYILTLILAALTFWAVEKPGRQLGSRLIHWLITQRKTRLIRVT
jgi:peptidoglycan/LPS O-acetylase OafA/YrhL